ncbi:HmuY family protein [Spirosoma sp. BT702]|uniref:HmuY family protein n=1 Tax=Spirosoma profusum TaxID=2771354 RepID=A0A926XT41_9BACT|nr:HmuY family protein [Spirosoma profusum]MBD2699114.1 HmuY family protein [Spirosoma profusum]
MRVNQILLTVCISTAFFACKKEDNPVVVAPPTAVTVNSLAANPTSVSSVSGQQPIAATGKFTLFSFKDGKQVANTDSATNKWDIGFRSTTIIINGGPLRSGQGGAYTHTGTFDALTAVPTSASFAQDQSATSLAITAAAGQGWYNYNQATNIISPIPGKVFVIRTGDGKYAKMEILSYYQGAPANPDATSAARYYTFRYLYQPDGSQNLK